MPRITILSTLKGIRNLLKKIEDQNKKSTDTNNILVIITIIAVVVAIVSSLVLYYEANESSKTAVDALSETRKLVEWTKPEPNITIGSDKVLWGENGTVYIEIDPLYSPDKGVKTYIAEIRRIKFQIFNAGRGPVNTAMLYLTLKSNKTNEAFPFKIYNISTPLHSLYFDEMDQDLIQSFFTDFPFQHRTSFQYKHINEKGIIDFPPSYISGEVKYGILMKPYEYSEIYENNTKESWESWQYTTDYIGPFFIGDFQPGEIKYVYVSIFGAVENYDNILNNNPEYWTQQKLFANGTLILKINYSNNKMAICSIPLESYFNIPN
jgi:hypothetical protein